MREPSHIATPTPNPSPQGGGDQTGDRGDSHGPSLHTGRKRVPRRSARVLQGQPAGRHPQEGRRGHPLRQGRHRHLAAHPQQEGLGGAALAEGMGRHRLEPGAALHLQGGDAAGARARAAAVRHHDGRAGDHRVRPRGPEEAIPAAHRQSRRLVVPGLLRAGRRLRPRLAEDQRPSATATTTSSTARRPGPPARNTPTGSSAWRAPTRAPRSRKASRSC